MGRIKRRRRARCRLPCQIVVSANKRVPGRVVTVSEGGLAVVAGVSCEQGDAIRLEIDPNGAEPISVSAIVWSETQPTMAGGPSRLRRLGCVISSPSDAFTALLERLLPPESDRSRETLVREHDPSIPIATPRSHDPDHEWDEADLPRSRELQPPPKLEPEESLPYFRIRLKQIGGPRTRIMTIRARSATCAEQLALEELGNLSGPATGWDVLHVSKVTGAR